MEERIKYFLKKSGLSKIILWEDILFTLIDPEVKTILDIGCGRGDPMKWIDQNTKRNLKYRVGVDIVDENLRDARQNNTHDFYVRADIRFLPFKENSFDACLILGILSYLNKEDGVKILKKLELISKKQIIVFTPVGQLPPKTNEKFEKFKEWDANSHISAYTVSEFKNMGYKVVGVNGLQHLRNRIGKVRFSGKLRILAAMISYSSQFITYFIPKFAFEMSCIKSLNTEELNS